MVQIITDSAADITLPEAEQLNIHIVPLTITFEDGECPQQTEADFEEFYRRLAVCRELPKTSQPSPEAYLTYYEAAREAGDEVLVLTLSGGLSGTVRAAETAKALCGYEKIYVVDTHHAISSQRILVEYAAKRRGEGAGAAEIAAEVEALRDRVTVSGVVDTLVNLRKGGRIPPSLAILGTALKIKPVIALQDTVLQTIGKAMGHNAGKKMLLARFEKNPPDPAFPIIFGYSAGTELGRVFMEETIERFSLQNYDVRFLPVGGVIGTHVGANCVAVAYVAKEPIR